MVSLSLQLCRSLCAHRRGHSDQDGLLFHFFAWLPHAYCNAPTTTSCLLAPLVTKVMIYVMIRMVLSVFGVEFSFESTIWVSWMPWLVVIAIICAAFLALSQREIKRMLAYLIVAEVGYMVGGVWIYNYYGLIGSIFHIISDACMTLCLFLGAGIILHKCKTTHFDGIRGLFSKCPDHDWLLHRWLFNHRTSPNLRILQ